MSNKDFRQEIADKFVAAIEADPKAWIKPWCAGATGRPVNGFTDIAYTGLNRLYLKLRENEEGYVDNRWLTFKQIQDKGYRLKAKSKGEKVEYYIPYDNEEKKWASWKNFDPAQKFIDKDGITRSKYSIREKLYTVFNGSCIEGIEKLDVKAAENDISEEEVVKRVSEGMGVKITEQEYFDRACYMPATDTIAMPDKKHFNSQEDYYTTACHELSHATGVEKRLNRAGFNEYSLNPEARAYEELVAEISSAFMGEYFKNPLSDKVMENHEAYVATWAGRIKDNKNYLFKAIKEASKATDYLVEAGDLERLKDKKIEQLQEEEMEF